MLFTFFMKSPWSVIIQSFHFDFVWYKFTPLSSTVGHQTPIMKGLKIIFSEDKCTQVHASQIASAGNDGWIGRGGNWQNLAKFATKCHSSRVLANVSLIFATQLILHETAFNHRVLNVDLSYFPSDDVIMNPSECELNTREQRHCGLEANQSEVSQEIKRYMCD